MRDSRDYKEILFEINEDVAWITINRPEVLNAFREQTLDELIIAVRSTREDPSIVAAVITGAGDRAFSANKKYIAIESDTQLKITNNPLFYKVENRYYRTYRNHHPK